MKQKKISKTGAAVPYMSKSLLTIFILATILTQINSQAEEFKFELDGQVHDF